MEQIVVYLESDHVIQRPSFDVRQTTLHLATDIDMAIRQAGRKDAAGILNSYTVNLDSLRVKNPEQEVLDGFDFYDLIFMDGKAKGMVSICSEKALRSLIFTNATFVSH